MSDNTPHYEIDDRRSLQEQMHEVVENIIIEEVYGLKHTARKYGCKIERHIITLEIPTADKEAAFTPTLDKNEPVEPPSHYMVRDAANRDICSVRISEFDNENWVNTTYVGPPEEEETWELMMRELKSLH